MLFSFQEFNEAISYLTEKISELMKAHPLFSTAKLAQKCFVTKPKCNEYHSGKGMPLTLRDLNQQIIKEIVTLDHFKLQVKAMGDRFNAFIKPDMLGEAKGLIKKLTKRLTKNKARTRPEGSLNDEE